MERDKRPRKEKTSGSSGNPLNVAAEKIEETRARVHGDGSTSLKNFLVPSRTLVSSVGTSGEIEETDRRRRSIGDAEEDDADAVRDLDESGEEGRGEVDQSRPEISENDSISSRTNDESENSLLGLSEQEKWIRRHFKKPLTLAMRDIVTKRPSDPVYYLASWLFNYRRVQERSRIQEERDRELAEERKKITQSSSSELFPKSEKYDDLISVSETFEGEDQIADSNFQNYDVA